MEGLRWRVLGFGWRFGVAGLGLSRVPGLGCRVEDEGSEV